LRETEVRTTRATAGASGKLTSIVTGNAARASLSLEAGRRPATKRPVNCGVVISAEESTTS